MEERLRSKYLYKIVLYLIKITPILMSGLFLLNTVLSYLGIDLEVLSHLCGISLTSLIFFYSTSIAFGFCIYHRVFIHLQSHICMYYGVEEDSEEAAYLTGFIAQKMHRCFKHFIYTGVK